MDFVVLAEGFLCLLQSKPVKLKFA